MRITSVKLALLAAAITSFSAGAQDDGRPAWSLKASIPTADLVGEWELSTLSGGASASEVFNAADVAQVGVSKGASFQLGVKLVSPAGVETDVTGSPKLIYRPKGCMSIESNGVATVLQSAPAPWTCNSGDPVPVTVVYADQTAGVAAINMYLFKIN
jgi:hypothetical protein